MRHVILYPGEDGYWVADCPSLPGCVSQGETKSEAIANIKEAIELCIAVLEEEGGQSLRSALRPWSLQYNLVVLPSPCPWIHAKAGMRDG